MSEYTVVLDASGDETTPVITVNGPTGLTGISGYMDYTGQTGSTGPTGSCECIIFEYTVCVGRGYTGYGCTGQIDVFHSLENER